MSNIIEDVDDAEYLLFRPVRLYLNVQILCYFVMFITALITVPYIVFIPMFGLLSAQSRKSRVESHLGYTLCFTVINIGVSYFYAIAEFSPNINALVVFWIVTGLVLVLELIVMRRMKDILREKFERNLIILYEKSKIFDRLSLSYIAKLLDINESGLILTLKSKKESTINLEITRTEIILPTSESKRSFIKILEDKFRP
jgi:hypothetical protein